MLDLWLWLSFRFPDAWEGAEEVAERRAQLAQLIDASIRSMGMPRWERCSQQGRRGLHVCQLCSLMHSGMQNSCSRLASPAMKHLLICTSS